MTAFLVLILFLFFIGLAYCAGSINTAILVCQVMKLPDPRAEGSKNPGATNVLRLGGKKAAAITLVGDVLKGFIPVALARLIGFGGFELGIIALAALLGHIFPCFFGFKGGKGVATGFGAIFALSWPVGLLALITWGLVAKFTKYSSLAAIVTIVLLPIYILFSAHGYFLPVLAMCIILLIRHWGNIQRLRAGTETKIGARPGAGRDPE